MNMLRETFKVFSFIFSRETAKKSYQYLTLGLAALIIAGFVAGLGLYNADDTKVLPGTKIEKVYFSSESEFTDIDPAFFSQIDDFHYVRFSQTAFEKSDKNANDTREEHKSELGSVFVNAENSDGNTNIHITANEGTEITQDDLDSFKEFIETYYLQAVMASTEFTPEQMAELSKGTAANFLNYETDKPLDTEKFAIGLILVMILSTVFLMVCLLYANSITGLLITDKTNKLVETLLISMDPVSNMMGKVMAVCAKALLQLGVWAVSIIAGMKIADSVVSKNPDAVLFETILKNHGISSETIAPANIVFAVLFIILGLVLYILISALLASFSDKLEEAAVTYNIFGFALMGFYMVFFYAYMDSNETLLSILKLIPFSSPFVIPADLLSDSFNIATAIISTVLMIVTIGIFGYLAAKVYKDRIVNTNSKFKLKKTV